MRGVRTLVTATVIRSLSKGYNLRGLRFAFVAAGARVAPVLARIRSPYAPSQPAAQVALLKRLETLAGSLANHRLARKPSALGWLFGKKSSEPPRDRKSVV